MKTLRGMSVAVIHEISQPLSTIEIEAENLNRLASGRPDLAEMRESSSLVARKARDLSELIRQLRRFGERDDGMERDIMFSSVLRDVRRIVEPAALQKNIELSFPFMSEQVVRGYDIEIRQAIPILLTTRSPLPGRRTSVAADSRH